MAEARRVPLPEPTGNAAGSGGLKRILLPSAGGVAAGASDAAIKSAIAKFMADTGTPAFEALFARVKAEFIAAEARLPPGTDGKPISLGLPDAFLEKIARKYFLETIGAPAFLEALVDQVVKTVREGHGPTRRNRVAMA